MSYYFAKTLHCPFDKAVQRTIDALKNAGFGILTEINVTETLKKKVGAEFRNYRILGACNPAVAHQALEIEDKIAIDPVASMAAVPNPMLHQVAGKVRDMLQKVIEVL